MNEKLYHIKQQFLDAWPLEKVKVMTIEQYTNLNKNDSFCYWLEARTTDLGSVWGGSAFKFGIYKRNDSSKIFKKDNRKTDGEYAWLSKYGSSKEEAFETIKSIILSIIEAVVYNSYESIDAIDLGEAIKWKIAYLYSDNKILNIFNKKKLLILREKLNISLSKSAPFSKLQSLILDNNINSEEYFEYASRMWELANEQKQYWIYSPGESAIKWEEFYKEGIIALAWDALEDLREYEDKDEIREVLQSAYGGDTDKRNDISANFEFANKMNIGDIVFVKKGIKKLLGYGEITSEYYYEANVTEYKHRRKIKWIKSGSWDIQHHNLPLKTLTDVTVYKSPINNSEPYCEYLKNVINSNVMTENISISNPITSLLKYKKQIILQGPPGTGKTREAKIIAKKMLGLNNVKELKNKEQFKIIQFHPSYTYEDFVRGIVSKPNEEGDGILYEAENKTIGKFAKQALRNYNESNISHSKTNDETDFDNFVAEVLRRIDEEGKYMISDKVYIYFTDNNRFKYKGDNWTAHPNGLNMNFSELKKIISLGLNSRQEINKSSNLNALTRQHATYYQNLIELYKKHVESQPTTAEKSTILQNYVLIIDEINRANLSSVLGELIYALEYRGEAVESMYEVDGSTNLILPPNLYIIGTMNTADRSVGHIDYAIRRRFAFVDVLPKDLSDEPNILFDALLFHQVSDLFQQNISPEFDAKDVALGHSYFIDKSNQGGSITIRLEYEIKPILKEYVKDGVLIGTDIIKKIDALEPSI